MARVLQVGDTHLGRTLCDKYTREPEYRLALKRISEIAIEKGCQFLIHTGDIFESYIPPNCAEEMFSEFCVTLSENHIQAVFIRGNHDSVSKLEAIKPYITSLGHHMVIRRDESEVITLKSKGGNINVACLPWLADDTIFSGNKSTFKNYMRDHIKKLCDKLPEKKENPTFLATHALWESAIMEGSERAATIRDDLAIPLDIDTRLIDYIAIGHIHLGQEIKLKNKVPAHYAGSTMNMTFGDNSDKNVLIIDTDNNFSVEKIEVPAKRMVTIKTLNEETLMKEDIPGEGAAWVKLIILNRVVNKAKLWEFLEQHKNIADIEITTPTLMKQQPFVKNSITSEKGILSTFYKFKRNSNIEPSKDTIAVLEEELGEFLSIQDG